MNFSRLVTAFLAAILLLAALNPGASAQTQLSIATGGTGGVYYPYGGALANILTENLEDTNVTAEVTAASVDNMLLIETGQSDIAFVLGDTASDAVAGNAPFENPIPGRTLATLYPNYTQIVTTADSGINTVADLAGKRVSVGAPGSGTEIIADRIMTAAGIDPREGIEREQLGVAESAGAIKDGKVDAFFWSGGLPTSAVTDLAATPNMTIKLIPHADITAALQAEYGSVYSTATIPAETYPGQTEPVDVVVVPNVLVVNESMDEQLAYDITRLLFEKQADLAAAHPAANELTLENATKNSPIPYHPGALRYYEEQGIPVATPPPAPAS
jgi:TRAP transporter TAXI family solute receptor